MSKFLSFLFLTFSLILISEYVLYSQTPPDQIAFVRQGVQRMIFAEDQKILLAKLDPASVIGMAAMHPIKHSMDVKSNVVIHHKNLIVESQLPTRTNIWFGGFNPFATYTIDLNSCSGEGNIGFEFSDSEKIEQFMVTLDFKATQLKDIKLKVAKASDIIIDKSIFVGEPLKNPLKGRIILQMLGSGLVLYLQSEGLPKVIGQVDFSTYLDLRKKSRIQSFQSTLLVQLKSGKIELSQVEMAITTGVGQADIRAITYENGDPFMDNGRLWYTMTIRGRALPHHIQGVFSLNPSVFDLKLEGIILFDRDDGLLRNEVASHIFYDRKDKIWRGFTTGFSAYANPDREKKQLLAVESKKDPRFGFSVMKAVPSGIVGDIEDPHILYDEQEKKWRILTCENNDGYKAVILESDFWNRDYNKIAGPVKYNSTGTSLQRIDGKLYCFSGSSEGKVFIYNYPDLKEAGTLKMDLPPWDQTSGSRVWPNVVQLPEGYPYKFIALMMDRLNFPGMEGPNWTYGALYLYHGQ